MNRRKLTKRERLRGIALLQAGAAATWIVTLALSHLLARGTDLTAVETLAGFSINDALEFVFGAVIAIFLLSVFRDKRMLGTLVTLVLGLLIWSGATIIFGVAIAAALAIALILWERLKHSFYSHDALVLAAALFTAIPIGLLYSVNLLIVFLLIVTAYDLVGVLGTRFIPKLAASAMKLDAPLLLAAPRNGTEWSQAPATNNTAAILGAGDVVVPSLFISAVAFAQGLGVAGAVLAGAILAAAANTAVASRVRTGIPAVPLLAAGMLTAYGIALLVR